MSDSFKRITLDRDSFVIFQLTVEQQHGSLNTMGSLIAYSNLRSHNTQQDTEPSEKWRNLCSQVVKLIGEFTKHQSLCVSTESSGLDMTALIS